MPTATVTVKYLNPPREGKKRGSIKTTDDRFFGVFPETIHLFNVGGTYEIEFTDGEYANVKTVKQVKAPEPAAVVATGGAGPDVPRQRGVDYGWQTHPVDAERMFVCATLGAFIKGGKIGLDRKELADTTLMLRGLWNYAFVANGRTERQVG